MGSRITVNEAFSIVNKEIGDREIVSCYEYNTLFVFKTIPNPSKKKEVDELNSFEYYINKQTKEIGIFQPFNVSFEEYENGREVKNFKSQNKAV